MPNDVSGLPWIYRRFTDNETMAQEKVCSYESDGIGFDPVAFEIMAFNSDGEPAALSKQLPLFSVG